MAGQFVHDESNRQMRFSVFQLFITTYVLHISRVASLNFAQPLSMLDRREQ